ncbi:MAG: hypothetical protein D6755_12915 [Anaerolineae bacterium]|nr:MAG: hypothetical protein D6755_12915 [Anaerolineae bacterium]
MSSPRKTNQAWIRWVRPWVLLASVMTYILGLGVVHYLGQAMDVGVAAAGLGWLLSIQAGMYLLEGGFTSLERAASTDVVAARRTQYSIWSAFGMFAAGASLTVVLIARVGYRPVVLMVMLVYFLLLVAYALPPLRAARNGYGEVIVAIAASNFAPLLAFVWQVGEVHRLLGMTTFALPFLHLAALLALELETYADDLQHLRYTLMLRLGWEEGMRLHNALIVAALLVLGAALGFGLSPGVGMPALLALPLGAFQIWYVGRIRDGASPQWRLLRLGALSLYILPTYLLTFALWVH